MNNTHQGIHYPALVFGEVLFDQFPDRAVLGGAPFNVARHLAGFGWNPLLISRVGRDDAQIDVVRSMERYGMDTRCLQIDPLHPTGKVIVELDERGHRFNILDNQAYDHIHPAMARLGALAARPQIVYFGSLASRHAATYKALNSVLRLSPGLRFLDINLRKPWYERSRIENLMRHAHVAKLNRDELDILAGWLKLKGSLEALCYQVLRRFDLRMLIITRDADGAYAATADGRDVDFPGHDLDKPIVDSVGAGDAFSSVAIIGLLSDWPLSTLLARADAFARKLLGIRGAVPEDANFYASEMTPWRDDE